MDITADRWKDYEILDAGNGMKLERWRDVILSRPDPQAIWKPGPAGAVAPGGCKVQQKPERRRLVELL